MTPEAEARIDALNQEVQQKDQEITFLQQELEVTQANDEGHRDALIIALDNSNRYLTALRQIQDLKGMKGREEELFEEVQQIAQDAITPQDAEVQL